MQDLITIPSESVREVFVSENGIEPYLQIIRKVIDDYPVLDMSIKKDRAEIKARVTALNKGKKYIEDSGMALAREMKKEPKLVDATRKKSKDTITEWTAEVRLQLTEWEEAEKERVDSIHRRINAMAAVLDVDVTDVGDSISVKVKIDELEAIEIDDSFAELTEYADSTKAKTLNQLYKQFEDRRTYEAEQKELAELREAKAAQDAIDRMEAEAREAERIEAEAQAAEAQRIRDAEDQVRRDAEAKALEEKQAAEKEALELKLKAETAEREKLEAEAAKIKADEAGKQSVIDAEDLRLRNEAAAAQAVIDAEAETERQLTAAKAAHDQKIIDDRLAEEAEEKRRADNKAHCKKINNAALKCLMKIEGMTDKIGKGVIEVIARKEVDKISIKY